MESVYIFGHKNPDTDSVCAAITLAYLKNRKKILATPYILGEVNNETKYVLNYFHVNKPHYLNDVKLQISNLNYKRECYLNENNTINDLYNYMQEHEITGVPIVKDNKSFVGIITMKDLLKVIVNPLYDKLITSYDHILKIIDGKKILKFDNEISGEMILSAYKTTDFEENIHLGSNNILIIGNRYNIIKQAIASRVKLIIIVGTNKIGDELLNLAKANKINIISSTKESLYVSKMLVLCNYVKSIVNKSYIEPIEDVMYVNDFLTIANKYRFTNYPVVDRKNKCLGLLSMEDVSFANRKKVILVDHNEYSQSADGIEEADIIEIVDHHKIGNINSSSPINFRNMAVGSSNTIIYQMFKEQKIIPPRDIAGLMLSGIISDTLLFNSPTTTPLDKKAGDELAKIAKIDMEDYAKKMFRAGASIKGKTIEELIYNDFKAFNINNRKIGIGQMTVIDYQKVLKEKRKYLNVIEKISLEHDYDILSFCITDVINHNTYILYNEKSSKILESVFKINEIYQGYELRGVVSRKKQIIPLLMEELK